MRLDWNNTLALAVDLQEKLVPAMAEIQRLVERSKFLLAGLAVYQIPIVHTRQYPKGLGDTLEEIRAAAPYAEVFDKTSFSCLDANAVRDRLVSDSRPNVLLAGIEGHICVQQTALDLLELGKRVYLVCDCLSSRDPFDCDVAVKRMTQAGVIPTTAESVLFEITRAAGSPQFKEISKLAKERK